MIFLENAGDRDSLSQEKYYSNSIIDVIVGRWIIILIISLVILISLHSFLLTNPLNRRIHIESLPTDWDNSSGNWIDISLCRLLLSSSVLVMLILLSRSLRLRCLIKLLENCILMLSWNMEFEKIFFKLLSAFRTFVEPLRTVLQVRLSVSFFDSCSTFERTYNLKFSNNFLQAHICFKCCRK